MTTTQIPSPREGASWEDDVLGMGPDLTLGYVVGQRRTADAAAAREMRAVTHLADLHCVGRVGSVDPVTEDALTRTVEGMRATASDAGLERQLRLAGEGAFTVDEFAVAELAAERDAAAMEKRGAWLEDHLDGTTDVSAVLDTPDAHALDHAPDRVATTLGDLGDTDTRDVRRAGRSGCSRTRSTPSTARRQPTPRRTTRTALPRAGRRHGGRRGRRCRGRVDVTAHSTAPT